jgi:VIT1/CCC1 family predicted Fe2+/Mn2+ transporter
MTLDALIMLTGAFVAILPFLGFPNSLDNALFFLAGIFVISLGIIVRRRETHSITPEQKKNENALTDTNPPSPPHENA